MKKRRVIPGEVNHVYQRTAGGVVVFYSLTDYLVFFTIFSTVARQEEVTVLALSPMPDHLHNACRVQSKEQLERFVQRYTRAFAQEWNKSRGRKGSLFRRKFGSVPKTGDNQVRALINYVNNNGPERKLCRKAEDYRWNFLSYAQDEQPYSAPCRLASASAGLRKALAEMHACFRAGRWVRYAQLDRWMKGLRRTEVQQLADAIVCEWNVLEYADAASYYGSIAAMLRSFHGNAGSEDGMVQETDPYSDSVYEECTRILLSEGYIGSIRQIPGLPRKVKLQLGRILLGRTNAKPSQLRKYLHLP